MFFAFIPIYSGRKKSIMRSCLTMTVRPCALVYWIASFIVPKLQIWTRSAGIPCTSGTQRMPLQAGCHRRHWQGTSDRERIPWWHNRLTQRFRNIWGSGAKPWQTRFRSGPFAMTSISYNFTLCYHC